MSDELNRTAPIAAQLDQTTEQPKSDFLTHLAESGKAVEGWPSWKTGLWNSDQAAQLDANALPPLPMRDGDWAGDDWFTADSMRDYARSIVAPYAEHIRHLERELEAAREVGKHLFNAVADHGELAERKHSIGDDPEFGRLLGKLIEVVIGTEKEVPYCTARAALIAHIDGRTAGTEPDELIEVGNRMATTLEVLACALKNPGTAEGVRRTVEEWRAAAPSLSGTEEGK